MCAHNLSISPGLKDASWAAHKVIGQTAAHSPVPMVPSASASAGDAAASTGRTPKREACRDMTFWDHYGVLSEDGSYWKCASG